MILQKEKKKHTLTPSGYSECRANKWVNFLPHPTRVYGRGGESFLYPFPETHGKKFPLRATEKSEKSEKVTRKATTETNQQQQKTPHQPKNPLRNRSVQAYSHKFTPHPGLSVGGGGKLFLFNANKTPQRISRKSMTDRPFASLLAMINGVPVPCVRLCGLRFYSRVSKGLAFLSRKHYLPLYKQIQLAPWYDGYECVLVGMKWINQWGTRRLHWVRKHWQKQRKRIWVRDLSQCYEHNLQTTW